MAKKVKGQAVLRIAAQGDKVPIDQVEMESLAHLSGSGRLHTLIGTCSKNSIDPRRPWIYMLLVLNSLLIRRCR